MDESFHKTKRHTAGLLCTIVPYHHLLPLFVVFHPKNALRFLVYSLFLGTMAAPGYLDGWTGLGTVASLEQQQKHLVFLSFCL
jgi:hypothetical protein